MTDADFLQAIIAAPDDDTPRLVYADWLDDRGDAARAEFIRLQCRLARGGLSGAEIERLGELALRQSESWKVAGIPGSQSFDRGFVGGITMSAQEFLRNADRLAVEAPITRVRLVVADGFVGQLLGVGWLRRIQALDLSNNFLGTRGGLYQFFNGPPWPNLHTLVLRNNGLWADSARVVADVARTTPALCHLDLSGNPIGDDGVAALAAADSLAHLEELILRCDELQYSDALHAAGAHRLAESRTMTRLTKLDLSGQYTGDAGLVALAHSPNARRLVELSVRDTELGIAGTDPGVEAIVESTDLGRLKRLDLSRNPIGSSGLRALAAWRHLPALDWIDLRNCVFPEGGDLLLREGRYASVFRM